MDRAHPPAYARFLRNTVVLGIDVAATEALEAVILCGLGATVSPVSGRMGAQLATLS